MGPFRNWLNQIRLEVTMGEQVQPVYVFPVKVAAMPFVNALGYFPEDREASMRKDTGATTADGYREASAVNVALQELRNQFRLQVGMNCNISSGDELFIDYGKYYTFRF